MPLNSSLPKMRLSNTQNMSLISSIILLVFMIGFLLAISTAVKTAIYNSRALKANTEKQVISSADEDLAHPLLAAGSPTPVVEDSQITDELDYQTESGVEVNSVADGEVTKAGWCDDLGYCVIVEHDHGKESVYGKGNGEFFVQEGQRVKKGEVIMETGCTGNCQKSGLHFAMKELRR
jgi:murein DD-endopeptidase MepM/ murein hydrolase activator NlpD